MKGKKIIYKWRVFEVGSLEPKIMYGASPKEILEGPGKGLNIFRIQKQGEMKNADNKLS